MIMNHKKLYRLYCEERLGVKRRSHPTKKCDAVPTIRAIFFGGPRLCALASAAAPTLIAYPPGGSRWVRQASALRTL
jgi:hypothetical protein